MLVDANKVVSGGVMINGTPLQSTTIQVTQTEGGHSATWRLMQGKDRSGRMNLCRRSSASRTPRSNTTVLYRLNSTTGWLLGRAAARQRQRPIRPPRSTHTNMLSSFYRRLRGQTAPSTGTAVKTVRLTLCRLA